MEKEKFDLYDVARQKTGKTIFRGEKLLENTFRLTVHVCIFNSSGKMLIQQRSATKRTNPNVWDITLGGCVQTGETTIQAAERELLEELGLSFDLSNVRPHLTLNFDGGFDDYFLLTKDVSLSDISFKDHEVQAVKWATEKEILKLIKRKKFIQYHPFLIHTWFESSKHPAGAF